jgi:hypothetical protein
MPMQLLNEAIEFMKILELILKHLKNGNGNVYLRKGTTSTAKKGSDLPE